MNFTPNQPKHPSYKMHRKQVITQIVLPVILAVGLMIATIIVVLVPTFGEGAVVGRWAAISTMWIILPIISLGLFFFAGLIAVIYFLARVLQILPIYSGKAQDYVYRGRKYIIRVADLAVRPIIAVEGLIATVRAFFGRK